MRAAIILLLVLVLAPTAAAAAGVALDLKSRSFLEGDWTVVSGQPHGDPCSPDFGVENEDDSPDSGAGDDADWQTYAFEFLRTGGMYRSSNEETDLPGAIVAARRNGNTITLRLAGGGADFKTIRMTPTAADRMRWRETEWTGGTFGTLQYAYRCARARHEVTAGLPYRMVSRLSASPGSNVYYMQVATGREPCTFNRSTILEFDLVGPASFSLSLSSESDNRWYTVRHAFGRNDTARLLLASDAGHSEIRIRWRDAGHIQIEPWGIRFRRCVR